MIDWTPVERRPGARRAAIGYGESDSKGRELGCIVTAERRSDGRWVARLRPARGGKAFGPCTAGTSIHAATEAELLAAVPAMVAKHRAAYLRRAKR